MDISQVENELARIRIDYLQTLDHNKSLKDVLQEVEKELTEKSSLIERYEVEVRRKHDEIERKQSTLDKLNRQFEKITASQVEVHGTLNY